MCPCVIDGSGVGSGFARRLACTYVPPLREYDRRGPTYGRWPEIDSWTGGQGREEGKKGRKEGSKHPLTWNNGG